MSRLIMGPFNRVEGDLEVTLDVQRGRVQTAHVNAPMYRGFEQILLGKAAHDALIYVPRICGICSVSQSVAAAHALADLGGIRMPHNGRHAINLTQANENVADHLTHFYLFFMPDFTRPVYGKQRWHQRATQRFAPTTGEGIRATIAARQRWMTMLGTMAGKWPHTQAIEAGGSSRPIEASERIRLLAKVREFRGFLEQTLFAGPLEAFVALDDEAALQAWIARAPGQGDLRLFIEISRSLSLHTLGAGPGLYLSYGAYPHPESGHAFAAGVWNGASQSLEPLDIESIREDATHAWLDDASGPLHPAQGTTLPLHDKPQAYSWAKAPRLGGRVVETGALARQLVSAQPLIRDLVARYGASVHTRVMARLMEIARLVPMMEQWLRQIEPRQPWCDSQALPADGRGIGLNEAARGSLGHWIELRGGRIVNYQIIAPTTWNFSPRDRHGTAGALERALEGVAVTAGDKTPVAVQHVVRSFDPCMVCTVH